MEESLNVCDFVIDPPQTRLYNTFNFDKADELFKIGFDETENRILELLGSVDLDKVIQQKMIHSVKNK